MRHLVFAVLLGGCGVFVSFPDGTRHLADRESVVVGAVEEAWAVAGLPSKRRRCGRLRLVDLPLDRALGECFAAGEWSGYGCYRRPQRGSSYVVRSDEHPLPENVLAHEAAHWLEDCARIGADRQHRDPRIWGAEGVVARVQRELTKERP